MEERALWFTAPRTVETRRLAVDEPGRSEILVESHLSAISPGSELLLYRNEASADDTIEAIDGNLEYPVQYGYATVGEVIAVGEDVKRTWQGQRVFAFHPHQTRFLTTPDSVIPVPEEMNTETAVFLPSVETAVTLVLDAAPRIGERVVVFGAGVIGLTTLELLRRFPLAERVVVEPIEKRRRLASDRGATRTLAPPETPDDYDLAIEVSGEPDGLNAALDAVGYDGRIIVGSWYGGKDAELEMGRDFHRDRISLASSQVSTIDPALQGRWTQDRRTALVMELLPSMAVSSLVTHRLPLSEAPRAYRLLDESPDKAVQVLLTYHEE